MNTTYNRSEKGLEPCTKIASTCRCIAYGRTGAGGRLENQDSFAGTNIGENVIMTVCDGMGGMNGGQTASRIAITEIVQTLMETPKNQWNESSLRIALENANAAIFRKSGDEPRLRGMGTTATVLMITPEAAFLSHIGDSRIYQIRNGKKIFRTFDHSKVFEMVAQKMITEEQARTSSFSNIITKALGIRPTLDLEVYKIPYRAGDRFVLCCDGIWNCRPEAEMLDFFDLEDTPNREVSTLTEIVNAIGIESGGGHDNLTAIVADITADSQYQYKLFRPISNLFRRLFERKQNQNSGDVTK